MHRNKWCLRYLLKLRQSAEEIWVGSLTNLGCCGWKRFWSGHWCFPQCRYGYRRGRPEFVKVCTLEESDKVQRPGGAVPWQRLWQFWNWFDGVREPVQAGQNLMWQLRLLCNNSSTTNWRRARWCGCRQEENYFKARADYCTATVFVSLVNGRMCRRDE